MRKTLLLLTTMSLALLLAGGVALAATVTCQVGVVCKGTSSDDTMTGTNKNDTINGLGGVDSISADSAGVDTIDLSRITTSGVNFDVTGPTLACPPTAPACVSLGGNFIENLIGTGFPDNLYGNTL